MKRVTILLSIIIMSISSCGQDVQQIIKKAKHGDAVAQFELANLYSKGKEVH